MTFSSLQEHPSSSVNKIPNMSEKVRSQIIQNEPESVIVYLVNFGTVVQLTEKTIYIIDFLVRIT